MMPIKRSLTLESLTETVQTQEEKQTEELKELKKMMDRLNQSNSLMIEKLDQMQIDNFLLRQQQRSTALVPRPTNDNSNVETRGSRAGSSPTKRDF
jgi:hydroxypyruvate isomerase